MEGMRPRGDAERHTKAVVAVAISASAWLVVLAALIWERPDEAFCEHRSFVVSKVLLLGAAALAIAPTAIGVDAAWRAGRISGCRVVGIAVALIGLATLVGAPALFVVGDAFLYRNC